MKTILIVEDDTDIQDIYRRMIEDTYADVRIEQRMNGQEGLDAIGQFKPDLILLDLLMPVMDGKTFLENLRHRLRILDVPVVVCSVNQSLAHKLLKSREVEAVLPKVFSLQDMVKVFTKFLGVQPKQNAPGL